MYTQVSLFCCLFAIKRMLLMSAGTESVCITSVSLSSPTALHFLPMLHEYAELLKKIVDSL